MNSEEYHLWKSNLIVSVIFLLTISCKGQDSISIKSDYTKLPLAENLILGQWVNLKDTNCYLSISNDSLILKSSLTNGGYSIKRYSYGISLHKTGEAPPGGNPDLKGWNGYYIQSWNDSGAMEEFWTVAIFSLSNKYLHLEEDGDDMYKRKSNIK